MELKSRNSLVYALLFIVWALVLVWQVEEHARVREAAKSDLRSRSHGIANTVSAVIRAAQFRGTIVQERIEPVLTLLVNGRTNPIFQSSELIYVTLLNTNGDPVVSVGNTNLFSRDILAGSECWTSNYVAFVLPVEGASILPSFRDFTNGPPRGGRDYPRREPPPGETNTAGTNEFFAGNFPPPSTNAEMEPPPPPPNEGNRPRGNRRPPWLRWMSEADFKALVATHELHGLVFAMSTQSVRAAAEQDLWLRYIIGVLASISAVGSGLAWRNLGKSSELQLRLVRASEMNNHLKEMNLAAAGLAHETRNPLNIISGMAQMLSRQNDALPETREKARAIVDEVDKVTAQLNEFINYSRPREVRRALIPLASVINEVSRALNYDLDEKKIRLEIKGQPMTVEADEQLLRQALFNLVLNATQAVKPGGQIQILTQRGANSEAFLEVLDDGPGVPPECRVEIFKPYFTTHQQGTGLGLAVVQQIVLAHGWEIQCLANEPSGARFRITHLKVVA